MSEIHLLHLSVLKLKLAQAALRVPPEVAFAMRSWPLLLPTFSQSLLLLTHFSSLKICFPQYFGTTKRFMQKNCL